ncbi:DNA cytosine methyltransferase [Corynebacterium sanguinis]|uniref:DNA cytosine methyltransferase n=1 Tax=Corynebacterium sanguinis TaxID=2594913 RepID=UPI00223B5985|nr:DNA cytosine methyltransferase [Corynebacterium sanguinis]MCT1629249.1 DNA cytosine methyltransferase [Corynebacterium sanguinis]
MDNKEIPFISLFSGAMGLDLGVERAGFETRVAVEFDPEAVRTIRYNRPDLPVVDYSITETNGTELMEMADLKDVPLVVGGPPCQAFSVFGKRRGTQDKRGQMLWEFRRIVDETRPHAFIMENVRGLLSMSVIPKSDDTAPADDPRREKGSLLQEFMASMNDIGYSVDCFVVNSVNYGAPQIRERLVLIGNRHNRRVEFPDPQFSNRPEDGLPPFKTLGDAIGGKDFVDPDPDLMDFSERKLRYLSMIPEGGNWRSLPDEIQRESMGKSYFLKGGRSAYWRRLSFGYPSPTVVTMPNHAGTSMCHPRETRAITVGEAAAIQEFPRDWEFQGTPAAKFRQVGNAVPPRLGQVAGEVVRGLLEDIESSPDPETMPVPRVVHLRPHVRTRSYYKDGVTISGEQGYYRSGEPAESEHI